MAYTHVEAGAFSRAFAQWSETHQSYILWLTGPDPNVKQSILLSPVEMGHLQDVLVQAVYNHQNGSAAGTGSSPFRTPPGEGPAADH